MKKEYILRARRDPSRFLKQRMDNEEEVGLSDELCEIFISKDIGLKHNDKVKVTIEKIDGRF